MLFEATCFSRTHEPRANIALSSLRQKKLDIVCECFNMAIRLANSFESYTKPMFCIYNFILCLNYAQYLDGYLFVKFSTRLEASIPSTFY